MLDIVKHRERLEKLNKSTSDFMLKELKRIRSNYGYGDTGDRILNNKDTDSGDKLNGDIEIEDFMLYKLGSRIYYKDRELYF